MGEPFYMADGPGLEPGHRLTDDGLAIRCITTLPPVHWGELLLLYLGKPCQPYKWSLIKILKTV